MRHITVHPFHLREQSFSTTRLSTAAESGVVAGSYFSKRQHQVPRDWPSAVSRFLDRGPARPAPKPSAASRPIPKWRAA